MPSPPAPPQEGVGDDATNASKKGAPLSFVVEDDAVQAGEGADKAGQVAVDVQSVRSGFMMSSGRSAPDSGSPHAAAKPAPQLRRLKSGQVTTAAEGKTVLESISFDHGEIMHKDIKTEVFKWILLVAAGLLVGFVGWALVQIEHYFVERKINTAQNAEIDHGATTGTLVFVGISVGMITFAGILVIFVGPLAQGSGIPLILAYLNGNAVPNFLSPRTFLAKFLGLIFSISGGLPIGIEGPFIHIGALCANFVSLLPQRLGFTGRYATHVARASSLRVMVACGGAAGVAAAFNAPIAGVLIVQQEAGAFWNADVTLRSFVCCTAASFSLNLLLNGFGNVMHGHSIIDFGNSRAFT